MDTFVNWKCCNFFWSPPFLFVCAKKGGEESVAESRLMGKQTLGEKQIIAPSPTVQHSVHFADIIGVFVTYLFPDRSKTIFTFSRSTLPPSPTSRMWWNCSCKSNLPWSPPPPRWFHLIADFTYICNGRAYLYNFPPRMGTHPHTSQQNVAPLASCKNCSNLTRTSSPRAGWFLWFLLQWILQQTLL